MKALLICIILLGTKALAQSPTPTPTPTPTPCPSSSVTLIQSNAPLSLIQNGVTTVYDKWTIPNVKASIEPNGAVRLDVWFQLATVINCKLTNAPQGPVHYSIPNIMTDSSVSSPSAAFLSSLVTKAFGAGVIK